MNVVLWRIDSFDHLAHISELKNNEREINVMQIKIVSVKCFEDIVGKEANTSH